MGPIALGGGKGHTPCVLTHIWARGDSDADTSLPRRLKPHGGHNGACADEPRGIHRKGIPLVWREGVMRGPSGCDDGLRPDDRSGKPVR